LTGRTRTAWFLLILLTKVLLPPPFPARPLWPGRPAAPHARRPIRGPRSAASHPLGATHESRSAPSRALGAIHESRLSPAHAAAACENFPISHWLGTGGELSLPGSASQCHGLAIVAGASAPADPARTAASFTSRFVGARLPEISPRSASGHPAATLPGPGAGGGTCRRRQGRKNHKAHYGGKNAFAPHFRSFPIGSDHCRVRPGTVPWSAVPGRHPVRSGRPGRS
jgi:hypothetical protein